MMRERFDHIEIIDLRGDMRTARRGDLEFDKGVFDIKVGTAITIAIADGSKPAGSLADITYADSWGEGLFEREAKLSWLANAATAGDMPDAVAVTRSLLDDFRPTPFQTGDWLSLREAFTFSKSGMKSGNNESFVRVRRHELRPAMAAKLALLPGAVHNEALETQYIFAAFDRRWFYNDLNLLQRPGPDLQRAWGGSNVSLQALKSGTGNGPAVWCNALIPDYDSFNRRGGYAFPLYDRRGGPDVVNISPALLSNLGENYGSPISPQDAFDAILALLSATSYTFIFAADLEDVFPHVPFPADRAVLMRAIGIGREIRAVETFARIPEARFRPTTFCRLATEPDTDDVVGVVTYREQEIVLAPNGRGRITGIPEAVWRFAVSGYRVLPRWIEARKGLPADLAFVRDLRDVAARIAELIHRFDEADLVLADTLADTLTREELGFPAPVDEGEAAGDG